jgi:phage terminase small subunit
MAATKTKKVSKKKSETDSHEKCTDQQELFCREFIIDLNGTQAAIRSGSPDNEASAAVTASRWLSMAKVQKRIAELKSDQFKRLEINADEVLGELKRIGFSDLRKIFKDDGKVKEVMDWPDDIASCISSIEVEETFDGFGENKTWTGYTKKVRFWDKTKCLELMGKHLKLFTEKHELSGVDGKPIEIKNASKLSDEELATEIKAMLAKAGLEK